MNFLNFKNRLSKMLLAFLTTTLIFSCFKEDQISSESKMDLDSSFEMRETSSSYWEGDIKVFRDLDQVKNELVSLNLELETYEDEEEFLIGEISKTNGNSLLEEMKGSDMSKIAASVFSNGNSAREFLVIDAQMSDVQKLIFNQYNEIKVGEDILTFFNEDKYFRFPVERTDLQSAFRNADRALKNPPRELLIDKDVVLALPLSTFSIQTTKGDPVPPEADERTIFEYKLSVIEEAVECNALTNLYLCDFQEIFYDLEDPTDPNLNGSGIHFGDWTIDWGDGSANTIVQNSGQFDVEHTFPTLGTYTVNVTVIYVAGNGEQSIVTQTFDTEVEGECGSDSEITDFWEEDGQRAIGGFIKYTKDIIGIHWSAKTIGYEWKNNKWRKERGHLRVNGFGKFRNSNCGNPEQKTELDNCGNCKSVRASKYAGLFQYKRLVQEGEIYSGHIGSFSNGSSLNKSVELEVCQ